MGAKGDRQCYGTSMVERHDTVIIGGGQAGLAMSYFLREQGREHLIVERRRLAERWRSERWDSLCFQFPNWSFQLPGHHYDGDAPDAFAHYSEVVRYLETYADRGYSLTPAHPPTSRSPTNPARSSRAPSTSMFARRPRKRRRVLSKRSRGPPPHKAIPSSSSTFGRPTSPP